MENNGRLSFAALEDKIVQGATVMVLNAIYEGDFVGFSYGFRPRRGPHDALDALSTAIKIRKVNWMLLTPTSKISSGLSAKIWLVTSWNIESATSASSA